MLNHKKWVCDVKNKTTSKEMSIEFYTNDGQSPEEKTTEVFGDNFEISGIYEIEDNE